MKSKIKKLLSIVIAVMVLFSSLTVAFTVSSSATADVTYYVSDSGDDTAAGTSTAPLKTINGVILAANNANYGAGDTVTVYVSGEAKVEFGAGTLTSHAYKLVITTAEGEAKRTITSAGSSRALGGNTEFENINLDFSGNGNRFSMCGYDVTFGTGVTFSNNTWTFLTGRDNTYLTVNNSVDLYFGSAITSSGNEIHIGGNYNGMKFADDVNITYNSAGCNPKFVFGAITAGMKTTYGKNVNFNLMDAASVTFSKKNGAEFENGGVIQIINSVNLVIDSTSGVLDELKNTAGNDVPKYIINNNTGVKDALSFTDTAGLYRVKEGYGVTAYKDGQAVATANATGGATNVTLDLRALQTITDDEKETTIGTQNGGPGTYTIEVDGVGLTKEYYIASATDGGNSANTGLTSDSPLLTVNEAIQKAVNDGIRSIDILKIKVVGTEGVAEWGTDDIAYNFQKLVVESNDPDSRSTLKFHGIDKTTTAHTGNLEFQNIIINQVDNRFRANGRCVTFGENVTLNTGIHLASGSTTVPETQTITINNAWVASADRPFYLGNYNHSTVTFNSDVNIIVDNSAAKPIFTFIGRYGGGRTNTVARNLNFAIYDASSVVFNPPSGTSNGSMGGISVSGAVQLVIKSDVTPNATSITNINNINPTGGFYHIIDDTGFVHGVEFDPSLAVGKYKLNIDRDRFNVYYTPESGEPTLVTGEYLEVPGAGKYIITVEKKASESVTFYPNPDSEEDAFNSQPFTTIGEAIQIANDSMLTTGDVVTIKLGTNETFDFGSLPKYRFNLVIESEAKTRLIATGNIANNEGAYTRFKNVKIYREGTGKAVYLLGSSAIFDANASFELPQGSLVYGTSSDSSGNKIVSAKQTVEINCVAPTNIYMTSWSYAQRTYNDDIALIINNASSATSVYLNGNGGDTWYNGNFNINVKNANRVTFTSFNRAVIGENSYVQLINNSNATINGLDTLKTKAGDRVYHIIDKTFQKSLLEFTDVTGEYSINTDFTVTAKRSNPAVTKVSQNGILNLAVDDTDLGVGTWEITTSEYFEDFNNTTIDELKKDWTFSSVNSNNAELTQGKLKIVSYGSLKEIPSLNKNKSLASKEQFISMDMKGSGFNEDTGFMIMARLGGGAAVESYAFDISNGYAEILKYDGVTKNAYGSYITNVDGFEYDGLWGRYPGDRDDTVPGTTTKVLNTFSYNADHTYRVSFSVVSGEDANDNEVAYVRGILLNLTTNEIMFDETFMDTNPYQGTEFAFISPRGNAQVYVDNLYFSTEKFRDGDDGRAQGDINGDGVYDIHDLEFAEAAIANGDNLDIALRYFDFDGDGVLSNGDLAQISENITNGYNIGEFNIVGQSDDEAAEMRENIIASTSNIVENDDGTYTYTSTAVVKDADAEGGYRTETNEYTKTGNVWYVSNGTVDGQGTVESPWTLAQLQDNIIPDSSYADTTYAEKLVRPGDAVLFERGKEYRTSSFMWDYATSSGSPSSNSSSYLNMCEDTLYGAYGTGDKPRFIDSAKNYAVDTTWVEVQDNIYRVYAPEIIASESSYDKSASCIVFDGGKMVGRRRAFPDSAKNAGKLYTLSKDGHFTYNEDTGYLYLYCADGNPSQKYTSIEVSRAIFAIQVNTHERGFVIDNLAFHGFGLGAIYGAYNNHDITVTNCEFGYSGGAKFTRDTRFGNAVSFYGGGKNFKVNYNWIYQTWDSAISPQGRQGWDYSGFEVIGNLLEYNNCDIELFDSGADNNGHAKWNDVIFSDNIMRFTTRGWGSREADKLRGIQGVIRGAFTNSQSIDLDWTNNIIDSPGREIFRFDNSINADNIFKFGEEYNSTGTSALGNNIYYLNPYVRNSTLVAGEYVTMSKNAYSAANSGATESTWRYAGTKETFYNIMELFDSKALGTKYYWIGTEIILNN